MQEKKFQSCKERILVGTYSIRSINKRKINTVKEEIDQLHIDILSISELKWTGIGNSQSEDHSKHYYRGHKKQRRNHCFHCQEGRYKDSP